MSRIQESQSFARVLAFTQLVIVCIGVLALYLLVRIDDKPSGPAFVAALASFVGRHAPWFVLVPLTYAAGAKSLLQHGVSDRLVGGLGVGLTVILLLAFAVPLCFHLI